MNSRLNFFLHNQLFSIFSEIPAKTMQKLANNKICHVKRPHDGYALSCDLKESLIFFYATSGHAMLAAPLGWRTIAL